MKIIFLILLSVQICLSQHKPEVVFRLPEKDLIPEGMTYDPERKEFYVGSIQKKKIVRISSGGRIVDFPPVANAGMNVVLGMTVHGGKLWVCNNSPEYDSINKLSIVHIFDLRSGKLTKKYRLDDGTKHLFNDVVVTSDGVGYVTDSERGAVYRLNPLVDSLETFLKPGTLRYPNGITLSPDNKKLFVSTGSGLGIAMVDLASKKVTSLANERFLLIGIDGLYRYKDALIGIQNVTFPEEILELKCDPDFSVVNSVRSLATGIPEFDTPTTGVIVDNYFYFIANSQLLQTVGTKGALKDPAKLKESVIMRVRLD